jgi:hypothetical protein
LDADNNQGLKEHSLHQIDLVELAMEADKVVEIVAVDDIGPIDTFLAL